MSNWRPKEQEVEMLELVISMAAECCLGKGTDTRQTFTNNLRRIADQTDKLPNPKGGKR